MKLLWPAKGWVALKWQFNRSMPGGRDESINPVAVYWLGCFAECI